MLCDADTKPSHGTSLVTQRGFPLTPPAYPPLSGTPSEAVERTVFSAAAACADFLLKITRKGLRFGSRFWSGTAPKASRVANRTSLPLQPPNSGSKVGMAEAYQDEDLLLVALERKSFTEVTVLGRSCRVLGSTIAPGSTSSRKG